MNTVTSHYQKGFTLIELLLYIGIVGSLLTTTSIFFATVIEARVKNQSIVEVDQQGTLLMEQITQTIRNAESITSPAAGSSGTALTLVVPTAGDSPTIFNAGSGGTATLGFDQVGASTDSSNANFINATAFTASASGTITSLNARVANVGLTPNNRAEMAIYSGASAPTTLLANSSSQVLTANSWNSFTIPSVNVTAGQKYWIAYNTNAISSAENNLRYNTGSGESRFIAQTYGTWPASWTGSTQTATFSMYATISTGGSGSITIKKGAAGEVTLLNNKVVLSSVSFTNLSRSGTPGVVRITFTLSRVNPTGKNEYSYQKTFTSTAALRQP